MAHPNTQQLTELAPASVGSLRVRDLAVLSGLSLEEIASVALAASSGASQLTDAEANATQGKSIVSALEGFRRSHAGVRVSLGHGSVMGAIRVRYSRAPRGAASLSRRSLRLDGNATNAEDLGGGIFVLESTRAIDRHPRTVVVLSSRAERTAAGAVLLFDRRKGRPWTSGELAAIAEMKAVTLFAEVLGASRAGSLQPVA